MQNTTHDNDTEAIRLALALKRLRARMREESRADFAGLSMSQMCILHCLCVQGPATAASLAASEHVSQQAIAQNIMPLKTAGLVESEPDPNDGRKTVISITNDGRELRDSIIASRNAWLARAIDQTIDPKDWALLDSAIELLERLADAKN